MNRSPRRASGRRRFLVTLLVLLLLPLPWRAVPPATGPGTAWRVDRRLEVSDRPLDPPGTVLWLAAGRPQLLSERLLEMVGRAPAASPISRGDPAMTPARAVPDAVAVALATAGCPEVRPGARISFRVGPVDLGHLADDLVLGDSHGLAVAVTVLRATGSLDLGTATIAATGRLGADGAVLPVGGIGPKVRAAARAGATAILVPREQVAQAREALADRGALVRGVGHLMELIAGSACPYAPAPSGT